MDHMDHIRPVSSIRVQDSSIGDEPITLAQAKEHLRIDAAYEEDDDYVQALITAARQCAEKATRRTLSGGQSWQFGYARFPVLYGALVIPQPPLQEVTSVEFVDLNNQEQTISQNKYVVEKKSDQLSLLSFTDDFNYPTVRTRSQAPVTVTVLAGSDSPSKLLCQAILMLVAHYYEQRTPVSVGSMPFVIPRSVDSIFSQNRVVRI